MRFVIITGLSGAGKSQAIKAMEDLGFFCVDNLPPSLIAKFAEICYQSEGRIKRIALVIDIRGGELFKELLPNLESLKKSGFPFEVLFLEAADNVLVKRYKETRRMHPLAPEGRLIEAIEQEKKILGDVRSWADYLIDTSEMTSRQLRDELKKIFEGDDIFKGIIINIISFGFKYGLPIESDLVFDVRFMPNPFYIGSMRELTGKDKAVRDYVLDNNEAKVFMAKSLDMLDFLIPNYIKEGKLQLIIGIGCTGGKHRSVVIGDEIHKYLSQKYEKVVIDHRDIEKDNRNAYR